MSASHYTGPDSVPVTSSKSFGGYNRMEHTFLPCLLFQITILALLHRLACPQPAHVVCRGPCQAGPYHTLCRRLRDFVPHSALISGRRKGNSVKIHIKVNYIIKILHELLCNTRYNLDSFKVPMYLLRFLRHVLATY